MINSLWVYWIIFDYLKRNKGDGEALKFSRYNGVLFQEYANDIIDDLTSRGNEKQFGDQSYTIGKNRYDTPDKMLFGDDYAIFVESSATRIKEKQTADLGIPEALIDDFEKIIFHNAKSLDTFINHFCNGLINFDGAYIDKITKIYPVILTIEGFPKFPIIDDYINREIKKRKYFEDDRIQDFLLLNVSDIEYLEVFTPFSLMRSLEKWKNSSEFRTSLLSVYLKNRITPSDANPSTRLHKILDDVFSEAGKYLFGDGYTPPDLFPRN